MSDDAPTFATFLVRTTTASDDCLDAFISAAKADPQLQTISDVQALHRLLSARHASREDHDVADLVWWRFRVWKKGQRRQARRRTRKQTQP